MPHNEQTIAAGVRSALPNTVNRLPRFSVVGGGSPTVTDSAYAQADVGHDILIGLTAAVNAGQVAGLPVVSIGEGCSTWGDGAVAIGKNAIAGQNAARDGAVSIGSSSTDSKNGVRLGSSLAFGTNLDDTIAIGTQTTCTRQGVSIGRLTNNSGVDGVAIGNGATNSEGSSIAIGRAASTPSSGLGVPNRNIAIGDSASVTAALAGASIAIGFGASTAFASSIALGAGASCVSVNEFRVGSAGNAITVMTLDAGAVGFAVGLRSGGTGGIALGCQFFDDKARKRRCCRFGRGWLSSFADTKLIKVAG
jgi:hypothetical protein